MALWICHLLLALLAPAGAEQRSTLLCRAASGSKHPLEIIALGAVAEPEPVLLGLLEAFWQGLRQPLPFFPATSLAWAQAEIGRQESAARRAWVSDDFRPGEGQDPAYRLFHSPAEFHPDQRFVELSRLFDPILAHLETTHAAA